MKNGPWPAPSVGLAVHTGTSSKGGALRSPPPEPPLPPAASPVVEVALSSDVAVLVEPPLPPALVSVDAPSVVASPVVLVLPTVALLVLLTLAEEVETLLVVE